MLKCPLTGSPNPLSAVAARRAARRHWHWVRHWVHCRRAHPAQRAPRRRTIASQGSSRLLAPSQARLSAEAASRGARAGQRRWAGRAPRRRVAQMQLHARGRKRTLQAPRRRSLRTTKAPFCSALTATRVNFDDGSFHRWCGDGDGVLSSSPRVAGRPKQLTVIAFYRKLP